MKGDDERAEAMARYLDGGPLAEEIEPLEPMLRRLRDLIGALEPDSGRVQALCDEVFASPSTPAPVLQTITLRVASMEMSLAFYRDALGLPVRRITARTSTLVAGSVILQLERGPKAASEVSATLDLRTSSLDRAADRLRRQDIPVRTTVDRTRRRCITLNDPDGRVVRIAERTSRD